MPSNSSFSSVKREINSINRGMRRYQRETGENIFWFEFDQADSTTHPIYDEGPSRKWFAGKIVPVLFFHFVEDTSESTEFGHYTVNEANFVVSVDALTRAGISNPTDTDNHFFDRFAYGPFIYNIQEYQKQGFVHGVWLTISVRGSQIKDDENQVDLNPYTSIVPRPMYPAAIASPYPPADDSTLGGAGDPRS